MKIKGWNNKQQKSIKEENKHNGMSQQNQILASLKSCNMHKIIETHKDIDGSNKQL